MITIRLRPMTTEAARELRAGRAPADVRVADGYRTEFSASVAEGVGDEASVGPFFIHRCDDDVVVGEIGGALTEPDTIEIGYAVVEPCWGRGYAPQRSERSSGTCHSSIRAHASSRTHRSTAR